MDHTKRKNSGGDVNAKKQNVDAITLNAKPINEVDNEIKQNGPSDVNLDLVFCDFDDNDFHIVKLMLLRNKNPYVMIPNMDSNLSELVDTIISYKATGSVARLNDKSNELGEPSEICGFSSIIHLSRFNKTKNWSKFIIQAVDDILSGIEVDKVGLLFLERLVNVPDKVGKQLLKTLSQDLQWATENATELGLPSDAYEFSHVLCFYKSFSDGNEKLLLKPEKTFVLNRNLTRKIIVAAKESVDTDLEVCLIQFKDLMTSLGAIC